MRPDVTTATTATPSRPTDAADPSNILGVKSRLEKSHPGKAGTGATELRRRRRSCGSRVRTSCWRTCPSGYGKRRTSAGAFPAPGLSPRSRASPRAPTANSSPMKCSGTGPSTSPPGGRATCGTTPNSPNGSRTPGRWTWPSSTPPTTPGARTSAWSWGGQGAAPQRRGRPSRRVGHGGLRHPRPVSHAHRLQAGPAATVSRPPSSRALRRNASCRSSAARGTESALRRCSISTTCVESSSSGR